jgi:geranylgeranyl reductase family protein
MTRLTVWMMTMFDVIVVGAGPAGSTSAALLARRGYEVLLVDRARFPRDKACAEYCSPGVEDVLRRTGAWDRVRPEVHRFPGMTVFVDGRPTLPVRYRQHGVARPAFSIPRIRLDALLLEHAAASGAHVVQGARVSAVQPEGEVMAAQAITDQDREKSWLGRAIIGADGLNSTVAHSLGIPVKQHWPRRVGLITHYQGVSRPGESGQMHVGPGVYCGLAPLPGGLVNVGLVQSVGLVSRAKDRNGSLFQAGLAHLPEVETALSKGTMVKRVRGMAGMARHVGTVAGEGFLLVGDAAGFLDPFTGEGIFRALRGGELAAGAIDRGLRLAKSNRLVDLTPYAAERRHEFRAKESLTWLIQLALTRPALFARISANIARSPCAAELFGNALGDVGSASELARPRVVAALLGAHP